MQLMTELEFVHQVYLRNKHKHPKGYIYSCPLCNDKKKRGYILISSEKIVCYCHNCGSSLSFKRFLEIVDNTLYQEYVKKERQEFLESLQNGTLTSKKQTFHQDINTNIDDLKVFKLNLNNFIPATENKECIEYCKKRKIPDEIIKTLKYCTHPKLPCGGHLVFPCYWKDDEHVYAFQSRSMIEKRFYIHSKNESFKVSGIFQVDLEKNVYIFESIIDSYGIKNSIAVMGADISKQVLDMIKKPVFVFDNDKTGLTKSMKYATLGYGVFICPTSIKAKDVNELMVNYNWTQKMIEQMIINNTFYGLSAITRLKFKIRNRKK